jgi:hypothetical protein
VKGRNRVVERVRFGVFANKGSQLPLLILVHKTRLRFGISSIDILSSRGNNPEELED